MPQVANTLSCRSRPGNVSLALQQLIHCLIKRLQDGQSSTPAGALTRYLRILSKNLGIGLSAFFRCPTFPSSEPPIIAAFSLPSTPRWRVLTLQPNPEGPAPK